MIRCIAIDDEPLALRQIVSYIEKTPFLVLENQFESARFEWNGFCKIIEQSA